MIPHGEATTSTRVTKSTSTALSIKIPTHFSHPCAVKHYHSFSHISPQPHTFSNCPYQHNNHLYCIIHWSSASDKYRKPPVMCVYVICPALWFTSVCCLAVRSVKQKQNDTSPWLHGPRQPLWSIDWLYEARIWQWISASFLFTFK